MVNLHPPGFARGRPPCSWDEGFSPAGDTLFASSLSSGEYKRNGEPARPRLRPACYHPAGCSAHRKAFVFTAERFVSHEFLDRSNVGNGRLASVGRGVTP